MCVCVCVYVCIRWYLAHVAHDVRRELAGSETRENHLKSGREGVLALMCMCVCFCVFARVSCMSITPSSSSSRLYIRSGTRSSRPGYTGMKEGIRGKYWGCWRPLESW